MKQVWGQHSTLQSRSLFAGATEDADPPKVWSKNIIQLSTDEILLPVSTEDGFELWLFVVFVDIFFFNFLLKWGFLSCNLGFSPPCESAPHYSQKQPFSGGKATLPTQEPANCLLLLDLSFYGSFKLFHIIRPQEMQLGPWPWEVGGFNASLQLQRGVSDAREAFSQQGHLVSSCHWRLKIRLLFHNPWWKWTGNGFWKQTENRWMCGCSSSNRGVNEHWIRLKSSSSS